MKRSSALRTDPELWEHVKAEVTADDWGGRPGQWSARKAQRAVALYKARGGGYTGPKTDDLGLVKWTREQWRTKSGVPSMISGERYLPSRAIAALSDEEYERTSAMKRAGMRRGQQFVPQPVKIAEKAAMFRRNPVSKNVVRLVVTDLTLQYVLLLRRSETDPWLPGHWSLPGGIVDAGESPKEAALRELFEETCIRVPSLLQLERIRQTDGPTVTVFAAAIKRKTPIRLDFEHDAYMWVHRKDLAHWPTIPYTEEIVHGLDGRAEVE